jgi:ribosomal RNA-processing protein 12
LLFTDYFFVLDSYSHPTFIFIHTQPIICGGLKSLAVGITAREESSPSSDATEDLEVLSNVSTKILPSLFKLVETLNESQKSNSADDMDTDADDDISSKEKQAIRQRNTQLVETVTATIGQLAQICPREFLQNLFKKVVQRLLLATTEAGDTSVDKTSKDTQALRMCSLLGLGQALVASGSLDEDSVSLLYRAVRPLVRSDEHDPRVQKRAYKVLAEVCEKHKDFVTSEERLNEMTDLLVDSIVTCQVSARHMRLKCMTYIVQGFDSSNQAHMAVIPKIMGEVLLCLKDSNAKTREAAYQLLLEMAVARDDMTDYFKIILAALGAKTTHMRSAAVMALSRLTFEYARHDLTVQSLLPSLMQTVAFLFDDSSREVTKSVIGFVRVCVAAMSVDQLEPLLPDVVGGIMKYNKGRDRFRAKIKIILKKLVRVYGYDVIAPLVPEKDTRLITHMRKLTERTARRKAAGLQDGRSDAHNNFDDMMESDEDDSDDGRTFMTGVTGFTRMTSMTGKSMKSSNDRSVRSKSVVSGARSTMTSKSARSASGPRIKAELQGEILDMLDASKMAKSVRFADMNMRDNDFSDDDDDGMDDMQFDNQGRIIISEGLQKVGGGKGATDDFDSDDDDENLQLKAGGGKRRRVSKFESVKVAKAAERDAANARKQKRKTTTSTTIGSAYKSKKAGGDVKKKGQQYEPYAYVPLNAKDYSKKNRSNAVSKMGTVVRSNKRKR